MARPPARPNQIIRPAQPGPAQDVGVFVTPDVLFPNLRGTEPELLEILTRLSRDDTLFHTARLNTLVTGPGDFDPKGRQERALAWMCRPDQVENINAFIRSRGLGAGPVTIFFQGQILELLRWVARHCRNHQGDGETFNDPERRQDFLKALLIAAVLWGKRIFDGKLSGERDVGTARQRALGAFRKGIEESRLAPHLGVALARGRELFTEHLPQRYPEFAEAFQTATGLALDQYRACVASLSIYTLFNRPEGPMFVTQTVAAETALRDVFSSYFELEGQTAEQLAHTLWDDFDKQGYRALRERPIFIAADGRGIILDPTFYAEKVSVAPFFYVLASVKGRKSIEVFGAFGLAFEDYAVAMLRRMYPHRPLLVDLMAYGLQGSNASGEEFEIDAARFDARAAAVFEIKAAWLKEEAITHGNHEGHIADLRNKYGVSSDPAERAKGVGQLARSVGAIVRGEWLGEHGEFAGVNVAYPVLLVHDTRMDAPALGAFLESEFRALVGAVPAGKFVAPLIVMTIQDLESLESSVEAFSLIELFANYTLECRDRLRSLHNFMAHSEYGKRIVPSRFLMESSAEILEVLRHEMFPNPPRAA